MNNKIITKMERLWFYLDGINTKPINSSKWKLYPKDVMFHLNAQLNIMNTERKKGLILNIEPFTNPPLPYSIFFGEPQDVINPKVSNHIKRHKILAGFFSELWDFDYQQELPNVSSCFYAYKYFYQVRNDHIELIDKLNDHFNDLTGNTPRPHGHSRLAVRIVVAIEFQSQQLPSQISQYDSVSDAMDDDVGNYFATYQWWYGNVNNKDKGMWKSYHPKICKKIEEQFTNNPHFRQCDEPIDIDGVRYQLQRISSRKPFDYTKSDQRFREPFEDWCIIDKNHILYDDQLRALDNCFVQFQKGNPKKRRPVRRILKGESTGLNVTTDEPCCVCLSTKGKIMVGCSKGHVVCETCLRYALRSVISDATQLTGILCGCLNNNDNSILLKLAHYADQSLQLYFICPPSDPVEVQDNEDDINMAKQFWSIDDLPPNIYTDKIQEWIEKCARRQMEDLYYVCKNPGCRMENWILKSDFDSVYRDNGKFEWHCGQGHLNAVLPSDKEIQEINEHLLANPKHYTERCEHNSLPLRKYRICPECISEGLLTLAEHDGECKQWPGYGRGHKHCFCFHCTGKWDEECNHGNTCRDPGIQQIRKIERDGKTTMQIGFVNAEAYIRWKEHGTGKCPETFYA